MFRVDRPIFLSLLHLSYECGMPRRLTTANGGRLTVSGPPHGEVTRAWLTKQWPRTPHLVEKNTHEHFQNQGFQPQSLSHSQTGCEHNESPLLGRNCRQLTPVLKEP